MARGPASLACAAELRRKGVRADIYDARPLPGGLNTYGDRRIQAGLWWKVCVRLICLRSLESIFNLVLGFDAGKLARIEEKYDAVFLGVAWERSISLVSRAKNLRE
ncbi:MAG: NAD(P)-binding protein [Edaphobacter sp.]